MSNEFNEPNRSSEGLVSLPTRHTVDQVVTELQATLAGKGITVFALVDHSGEAAKAGQAMPNTKLRIFGSPKAGTPLMLASPSAAIDLPLKILVAEDTAGRVTLTYNSPAYLGTRHHLPDALLKNIAVVEALARQATE